MAIKITRTLFVGLGGTGVKAILRAKQCFMDAYGEIPPMVGFLAIDTDKKIRDQKLESRRGKDVKLSETEICFCPIDGLATEIYLRNPSEFTWMPKRNTSFLKKLKNEGAGQVRTNGRFLARYNATTISQSLQAKVAEIGATLPLDCKFTYDMNTAGMQYPTNINIVGSIAGGTGAGLMIDMINLAAVTMKSTGLSFRIFPWLVLPDVFKLMAPGIASQNVYANAYGVLTELDYLYHLPVNNTNPINFGFTQLMHLDDSVYRTTIFNNKNKSGEVFQNIDEITDAVGRCMFLPANGVDGTSIEDNLSAASFAYNVGNKEAHYSSAGCSELVYDNQAVGNVIARAIISDLCQALSADGNKMDSLQDAVNWASSEAVGIEEHGVNYLTDSLLTEHWSGSITFDKESDVTYIKTLILSATEAEYIIEDIKKKYGKKLSNVKNLLKLEVSKYLSKQTGAGAAISFLEALLEDIKISKKEMENEKSMLMNQINENDQTTNWSVELNNIRGLFGYIKQDEADALSQKVASHIATKRDNLRHGWAIQFYTELEEDIQQYLSSMHQLSLKLKNIAKNQESEILEIQRKARTSSKFQIYLHEEDVKRYSRPDITTIFTAFSSKNQLEDFVGADQSYVEKVLWDFAKEQPVVHAAVNVSIEDKLSKMPQDQVLTYIERLKHLASPMWNTNLAGYVSTASPLSGIFAIACYDAVNGVLQEKYKDLFKIGAQDASFVTTRQTDRIMLYRIECYSPVYAINNMVGYKREAEEALLRSAYPTYYIDEQWHQRMQVEGFDVYPKSQGDTILPNWVNAIVYGYIKYDEESKTYYIMSDHKGDILRGGYLPLGQRRDVAFDAFQNMELHKEVEEHLKNEILEKGRPHVDAVMSTVKAKSINYVIEYAQLSPIELDAVRRRDQAYQMVIDLLEKEVGYIKSLSM